MNYDRILSACAALLCSTAIASAASVLPGVGTYEGSAGVGTANGVVTAPPAGAGSEGYIYVSTSGSSYSGAGLGLGSETNGSTLTTLTFSAEVGDELSYYFNYVTSDGSSYVEYSYATLNDVSGGGANSKLIFTARTTPSGDTVPGFGLPAVAEGVTLVPSSSAIIPGGPEWSPLGQYSGACYGAGCGYTGWIQSLYTIETAGTYSLTFGVVNWSDSIYDSGLAIAGLKIDGEVIVDPEVPPVPLPAGVWLLGSAVGALMLRRKR